MHITLRKKVTATRGLPNEEAGHRWEILIGSFHTGHLTIAGRYSGEDLFDYDPSCWWRLETMTCKLWHSLWVILFAPTPLNNANGILCFSPFIRTDYRELFFTYDTFPWVHRPWSRQEQVDEAKRRSRWQALESERIIMWLYVVHFAGFRLEAPIFHSESHPTVWSFA